MSVPHRYDALIVASRRPDQNYKAAAQPTRRDKSRLTIVLAIVGQVGPATGKDEI
jgi:hypothetical protein